MSQISKRGFSANLFRGAETIFKCPVCGERIRVIETRNIICPNHHTFDFAKQGYVNLVPHSVRSDYDRDLFEARRKIIADCGFFDPLIEKIVSLVGLQKNNGRGPFYLLDMGCGEGSHLSTICGQLRTGGSSDIRGIGIDLSKAGIYQAASEYSQEMWAVADLANPPLNDRTISVILNILSPSNYNVFDRLLKEDGMVIKVVPRSGYLHELRDFFFNDTEKRIYSNSDIIENFRLHFRAFQSFKIHYVKKLSRDAMQSLIRMTPLTWKAGEERRRQWMDGGSSEITIDLDLIAGRKKDIIH